MDYSLDKVKHLYDKYGIGKDRDSKNFVVYEKGTNNIFDFSSELANDVKFAYAWVYATKYGHSVSSPNNELTKEEYERAFNETSRLTYDIIMSNAVQGLQSFGRMYKPEAFKKEVLDNVSYAHATDIVDGLFSKPNIYESFETWCRKASGLTLEEVNALKYPDAGLGGLSVRH